MKKYYATCINYINLQISLRYLGAVVSQERKKKQEKGEKKKKATGYLYDNITIN